MVWTTLRERVAGLSLDGPAVANALLATLRGELPAAHPHRATLLALTWLAFRFAPEGKPDARVGVPLRLTLMQRGETSAADLVEDLEVLDLGDARELEELAFGEDAALVDEIEEARTRPLLQQREAPLNRLLQNFGGAEPEEPATHPLLVEARALEQSHTQRASALAMRCGREKEASLTDRAEALCIAARISAETSNFEVVDDAIALYRESLDLAYSPVAEANLAAILSDHGEPERARTMVRHALGQGHPRPASAYTALAIIEQALGRNRDADRAYGHCLVYQPSFHSARWTRHMLRIRMGDLDGALRDAERAVELGSDRGYQGIALAERLRGRFDAALAAADRYVAEDKYYDAALVRAAVHEAAGDLAAAEADCDRVLRKEPRDGLARLLRLSIREKRENAAGAIEDLACVLVPEIWKALAALEAFTFPGPSPFSTLEQAHAWRARLLAKMLPDHPALGEARSRFEAGDAAGGLGALGDAIACGDVEARAVAKASTPALLRALGNAEVLRDHLRALRSLL